MTQAQGTLNEKVREMDELAEQKALCQQELSPLSGEACIRRSHQYGLVLQSFVTHIHSRIILGV